MLTNTSNFKSAIFETYRQTKGKIDFTIVNTVAQNAATITSNGETVDTSDVTEVLLQPVQSRKYITCEKNYTKLDGTHYVAPLTSSPGLPIGYISNRVSSEITNLFSSTYKYGTFLYGQGTYSFNGGDPEITIDFPTVQDILGLTIVFDELGNTYPTEFDIAIKYAQAVYGQSIYGQEKYSTGEGIVISVTNNNYPRYVLDSAYKNVSQIIITFYKTNNPAQRIKITSLSLGPTLNYMDDELISIDILEEIELDSSTLPSNEVTISILDMDRLFNIMNPIGLYSYLQRKQKIEPYIGLVLADGSTEWVRMGIYYLEKWQSKQGGLDVKFVANDVLLSLGQSTYRKSTFGTTDLKTLAENILDDAGIINYIVDSALSGISTNGYIAKMTHREALRQVAVAGMCVVYEDRYGYLRIEQIDSTLVDSRISFDNCPEYPDIELLNLYNKFNINVKGFETQSSSTIAKTTIAISGTQTIFVEYETKPATNGSASVSGGGAVLNSAIYYSNGADLNITASGDVTITIIGTEQKETNTLYSLDNVQTNEQEYIFEVNNTLITNNVLASNIATWLKNINDKRKKHSVRFRQNPTTTLGDIVQVENIYTDDAEAIIVRQEFNYNGALDGYFEGRE
jgi:hypothetical protein